MAISVGKYTERASLSTSVEAICQGLTHPYILVAHPKENSIELRIATLWERILSFFRFKPTNIRLSTLQPLISQFFKENDSLLASTPSLYPQILQIYTSSLYSRDKDIPGCLKKYPTFTKKPPILPSDDNNVIGLTFETDNPDEEKTILVSRELLPSPFLELLDKEYAGEPPRGLADITSEEILAFFLTYQRTGILSETLTDTQRLQLASLAAFLLQKELTEKLIYLLIKSLKKSDTPYLETFVPLVTLVTLMLEDALLYVETPDQFLMLQLIAKIKTLGNALQAKDLEFLETYFKDHPLAQFLLAQCYEYGIGIEANFEKAVAYYKTLAGQNHAWGKCELGRCYQYVGGQSEEAFKLYTEAAEKGIVSARYHKAVCYAHGLGTKKDEQAALQLLQELAQEGSPLGLYGLGNFYRNGTIAKQDLTRAVKLFELSAAHQEPRALYELGICYEKGIVVIQDLKKALELWEASAIQGLHEAQLRLVTYYEAEKNIPLAKQWCKTAMATGSRKAKEKWKQLQLAE